MTEHNRPIRRRRRRTKKTVVDSASRNAATLSDGCNPELVRGADFDGIFEIPVIKKPRKYVIPKTLFHSAGWIKLTQKHSPYQNA